MRDWLEAWWITFLYSTKTQICLVVGISLFIAIPIVGDWMMTSFELHGPLAPLTNVIRERFSHRYEHIGWVALFSFLLLAVKALRRDKKRLLG